MSGRPWMKFYPADWRAEPSLRFTSLAARGLWIEMLAIMHEAEPRGSLVVKGRAIDADRLAAIVGSDANTVGSLLDELEENGVFSRKKNGVVFSRRMERDENKSRKNRENGEKGGNPTLCNKTEKDKSVNPTDKAKIPEARYQSNISSNEDIEKRDALGVFSGVLDGDRLKAVMAYRRSRKLTTSAHAMALLATALKACPDPNAAADEMILRGWKSVKPEWLENSKRGHGPPPPKQSTAAQRRDEDIAYLDGLLGIKPRDEFDGYTLDLSANG